MPFLPLIQLMLGLFGIICCSASKVVYGRYIWDPLEIAAQWDGPAGRCGAFFIGLCWVVAQIGTNLSANVISCANDLTCLFPKYINIRRGVIIATVTAAWIMQPWKIVYSAASLLAFMSGLGIFLAPIAAILGADYCKCPQHLFSTCNLERHISVQWDRFEANMQWSLGLAHKQHYSVPDLYRAHGIYRYNKYGTNWRAVIAFLVSVVPNIPGMVAQVNPDLAPAVGGAIKLYYMFYFWGYTSAFVVYSLLCHFFPAKETLLEGTIYEDSDIISAASFGKEDGSEGPIDEKKISEVHDGEVV